MTDEEREDLNMFKHDLVKQARWWQWKAETLEKENERLKAENAALCERLGKAVEFPCVKKSTKWAWSLATGDSVLVENHLLLYKDNEGYVHYEEIDDNEEAFARLAELKGGAK